MKTLKKINEARKTIRLTTIEKKGWNDYSKYKYFLPEQISEIVNDACGELNLFNKFDLLRTDIGLMASLEVIDLDDEENNSVLFQIATDIPEIKATNVAQQLGGCVTYSERYLLQIAYDIKDNNLDFDTKKSEVSAKKTKILPGSEKWIKAVEFIKGGGTIAKIKESYEITETHIEQLILQAQ